MKTVRKPTNTTQFIDALGAAIAANRKDLGRAKPSDTFIAGDKDPGTAPASNSSSDIQTISGTLDLMLVQLETIIELLSPEAPANESEAPGADSENQAAPSEDRNQ